VGPQETPDLGRTPGRRRRTAGKLAGAAAAGLAAGTAVGWLGHKLAQRRREPAPEIAPGPPPPTESKLLSAFPSLPRPLGAAADLAWNTWTAFNQDNIPLVSAGVTFFMLLAFFPGIGAFVSLYGLLADVGEARQHLQVMALFLPRDVIGFIGDEMLRIASARGSGGLSMAFAFTLGLSVWSANGAVRSLFLGMNVALEQHEKRGWLRLTAVSLVFTVGILVFFTALIGALVAGPTAAALFGRAGRMAVTYGGWPVLLVLVAAAISVVFRFAPSRPVAHRRWFSWGSVLATVLWLVVSLVFSAYVGRFAHYDRTYGSLGAVIGLMTWLWLSTQIVLGGAELDNEIARRRAHASGSPAP
jgi:membrane protein